MVVCKLTCEKCGFQVKLESMDTESAESLSDYGKINKVSGKPLEFNCLLCGRPLKKNIQKVEQQEILFERSKNKESFIPSEMPFD